MLGQYLYGPHKALAARRPNQVPPGMNTPPRYRTPPEAAKELRVGHEKILHFIRTGQLVAVNLSSDPGGRPRWLIAPEELERFLAARSSTPVTKTKPIRRRKQQQVKDFF